MQHSLEKCIFILILMKFGQLQSAPIFDSCTCVKSIPVEIELPPAKPAPVAPSLPAVPCPSPVPCLSHGYKIEIPPPVLKTATLSYSMDVVVETPVPDAPAKGCNPHLPVNDAGSHVDDFSGVKPLKANPSGKLNYEIISSSAPDAPSSPLSGAYSLKILPPPTTCVCGEPPHKPACRYVSKGFESNSIYRERSKRDISSKKHQFGKKLKTYFKSLLKAKKPKLVKRDIKGEYDLLQREQAEMDLTIPEIIQYMPETLMPNFERGKCNIGCKNCIQNDLNERLTPKDSTESKEKENDQPAEQQSSKASNENTTDSPIQHMDMSPQSDMENYDKRSVNPFESPNPNPILNPSHSGLLPPQHTSTAMEMTKLAQNPVNPIWHEPQPWTDPNSEFVYDRLGHKYKVKNGSFQLMKPDQNVDEVNTSAKVASVDNTDDKADDEHKVSESSDKNTNDKDSLDDSTIQREGFSDINPPPDAMNDEKIFQAPILGAPRHDQHNPSYDPYMDKVIRDIVYQHPDFVEATQHAPGSLTLPEEVTSEETMQFLGKLIQGRFSKWFGSPSEHTSMHNLHDLNRFSRETGTSIKFVPVVTVDNDRLNMYRQKKTAETS